MVASILTPIATNVPKQVSLASTFYEGKRKVQIKKEQEALENYSGQLQRIPFGCYDILLVLDNREVRKRGDRDFFQLELEKLGVPVLTKQMELGDICWVARSKTNVNELYMLDYIVERKKNDDLASSIKDGRFKEQKHRLNKCGVSNLIYLVEEYDPTLFSSAAMTTAITETIVGNDFFVKMTTNAMDTVQYLAKFTKLLVHQYKDVDLYVLDTNDIRLETHHVLRKALSKDKPCLIPFQTFNSLNTKTKVITNRDLWQKQLLTIRGVSQEKARILSRHFPTFQSLISKLDEQRDEESKIKLFTDLKMGPALAKKIVNVFC
jgi:ERCC4-type nuclease